MKIAARPAHRTVRPAGQGAAMLPLTQDGVTAEMPAAGDVLAFEALRPRARNKGRNDRGRDYETV
jgi:hypothetical protein